MFVSAGLVDFEITWRKDVFDGAPQESSAASFGTVGINFRARKAASEAEWHAAMAGMSCPVTIVPLPRFDPSAFYDAGDAGCAYGPLTEIANVMKGLAAGQTLEVRATDPTVKVDLPTWVRMRKYHLLEQVDDRYLIRK